MKANFSLSLPGRLAKYDSDGTGSLVRHAHKDITELEFQESWDNELDCHLLHFLFVQHSFGYLI